MPLPANPSFGMTPTVKSVKAADYNSVVGVIPKEGLAGPANQSLFWYENDKDLKVCFPVAPHFMGAS